MLEMDVHLRLDEFSLAANLTIDGPATAFFGPAGSGKSTLLGIIAGSVSPQRGWIRLGSETLLDTCQGIRVPAWRRRIGFVGSAATLYPRDSVRTHLLAAYSQVARRREVFRFREIVRMLEVEDALDQDSGQLSAELRQRIAVAHALLQRPRLLLVDEPFQPPGGPQQASLLPFLSRVRDDLKIPFIYVSPTLGEILPLTSQMVLMAQGRILGAGDVHQIVADRILLAGAALQGIENILPVTIIAHDAENGCTLAYYYGTELVLPIAPHLPRGISARVSIRSSNIALSKRLLDGISIQNQIKGRVCTVIRTPEHAVVQIDCGNTLLAGISLRALRDMDLQEGDTVYCLIKSHAFSYTSDALPVPARSERRDGPDAFPSDGHASPTKH